MKSLIRIALIAVVSLALIIWVILSDFGFGKYDDFQEAIHKGIPYEINNIIHTEQHDDVTVVNVITFM